MRACPSCGEENSDRARFCQVCGSLLAEAPEPVREERKVVTVLFCDLVGFTASSDRADPEDINGFASRDTTYQPIIRPQSSNRDAVTWGEFVEARFLHEYRTHVPLQQIRPLVEGMRQEFGVRYSLAHLMPLVDRPKRDVVLRLQELTGTPDVLFIVRWKNQQLQWSAPVEKFLT